MLHDVRKRLEVGAHVRVLLDDVDLQHRAGRGVDDLLRRRPQQLGMTGEQLVVEVAQDRADARARGVPVQLVDVDEALAAGRRLGRQPVLRQRGDDAGRDAPR